MRPFKKVSKSKQKQRGLTDESPIEASGGIRIDTRTRSQNWSNMLDAQLLGLMRDEHTFGNCVNGSFTPTAWKRMENPAYAKCRDKPFPAYDDIDFLTQNTTASGRYGFTTVVDTPPTIESSSGSSPGEDDTPAGIRMSACDISPYPFEAGTSRCTRNANDDGANTSRSPSPPVMRTTGASGSGHSSGSKRARSPERSNKQPQMASTSRGRKKKVDARASAMADMVEQGKEKLVLVRQLCQVELSSRADMPSQNQCMQRVYGMTGLSDDHILAVVDAFKEDKNRNAFMSLNDKHAKEWVERQLAQQNLQIEYPDKGVGLGRLSDIKCCVIFCLVIMNVATRAFV
uniref:Myb/SANT-like domain-containing protein n=1 Tax=Ananas comosus var. bracteatus TaxID=296719 RepID=A0A6V7NGK5_ANACO|nr:unnamed protein product [Ananas comosus var. bracteatus]